MSISVAEMEIESTGFAWEWCEWRKPQEQQRDAERSKDD